MTVKISQTFFAHEDQYKISFKIASANHLLLSPAVSLLREEHAAKGCAQKLRKWYVISNIMCVPLEKMAAAPSLSRRTAITSENKITSQHSAARKKEKKRRACSTLSKVSQKSLLECK